MRALAIALAAAAALPATAVADPLDLRLPAPDPKAVVIHLEPPPKHDNGKPETNLISALLHFRAHWRSWVADPRGTSYGMLLGADTIRLIDLHFGGTSGRRRDRP